MCHIGYMKTISISDLHERTGVWIRKVVEQARRGE
jgi:hypothetical protein